MFAVRIGWDGMGGFVRLDEERQGEGGKGSGFLTCICLAPHVCFPL